MSKLSELHEFAPLHRISGEKWKKWRAATTLISPTIADDCASLVLNDTLVGIEVEAENVRDARYDVLFWNVKEDNSLRNHGIEFVSCPLVGEQIVYALHSLESQMSADTSFSHRTSVHVHMNVQDMSPIQISKLLLVYLTVERLLYRFVGHHRDKNIFCVPLYDLEMVSSLYKSLKTIPKHPLMQGEGTRYSGLNFDPVLKFGTVEFRHMHGTNNSQRLLTWINLIMCIKQHAMVTEEEILIRDILSLNTSSDYKTYVSRIFGRYLSCFPETFLNQDVELGVLTVKRSLFSGNYLKTLRSGVDAASDAYQTYVKVAPAAVAVPRRPRVEGALADIAAAIRPLEFNMAGNVVRTR